MWKTPKKIMTLWYHTVPSGQLEVNVRFL